MPINAAAIRQELIKWVQDLDEGQLLELWKVRRHMSAGQLAIDLSPDEWVHLDQAARLLDMSAGHLRRLCINVLLAAGQAKKARPSAGGKPTWFVARSYDPALIAPPARDPGAHCAPA